MLTGARHEMAGLGGRRAFARGGAAHPPRRRPWPCPGGDTQTMAAPLFPNRRIVWARTHYGPWWPPVIKAHLRSNLGPSKRSRDSRWRLGASAALPLPPRCDEDATQRSIAELTMFICLNTLWLLSWDAHARPISSTTKIKPV